MSQSIAKELPHSYPDTAINRGPDRDIVTHLQWEKDAGRRPASESDSSQLREGLSVVICTFKRPESLERLIDSFSQQDSKPRNFIIVDATPTTESELMVRNNPNIEKVGERFHYFRVKGGYAGLTRQRNFSLRCVDTDLVAFFDDDVVLQPSCLREMEKVHRAQKDTVIGVGAFIEDCYMPPDRLWRTRKALGIISNLAPGSYQRSGHSVPWCFLPPTDQVVEGDWLIGCSMMWKTSVVREVGFREAFAGYAQGEDLDFSLRAKPLGKIVLAGAARLKHFHEPAGRPNFYKIGYMAIYNRFHIHRHGLPDRNWRDVAWFVYAWSLDTLMISRRLFRPRLTVPTLHEYAGRFRGVLDLILGR